MTALPITTERDDLHATMLARVEALKPVLRERNAQAEADRQIPVETIADFHEAGLWQLLQPKRWGGLEAHPNVFFDCLMEIAKACPSTAWVYGVVAVHNWQMGLFSLEAQEDVWGDDPNVLISSSYAPTGKVKRVEGGYELSGRWSFSSGSAHCDWAFLGAFVPPAEEGQHPDMRTFLVPKSDYTIEDTWHTMALKGTGSNDIVVDKVFVPEHHTHRMADGFKCDNPGNAVNDAPLFRLPFGQLFVRSVSTSALGIARGALEFYLEVTATKVGASDGNPASKNPFAQVAVAKAHSTLDQLEGCLHRNFDTMMAYAEAGETPPIDLRVQWRWESAEAVTKACEVVDELFSLCGGRAIFLNSPMHRYFVDVHAARAHYANRPERPGTNFGSVALGHRTTDFFI